jgi:hypothetical protein
MQFHWRTDEVFHRSPAFLALTHQAVVWLSARGVRSGSALAAAHVGVEVLLDAALSDDERAQGAYRAALEGAAPSDLGRYLSGRRTSSGIAATSADGCWRAARSRLTSPRRPRRAPPAQRGRAPALALDDTSVHAVRRARIARPESHHAAPLIQEIAPGFCSCPLRGASATASLEDERARG